jgi:pimeloyl-ACP methyl ester carboxylesterase
MDEPSPTTNDYMSQRLRLNYLDWGNPDAPTLILVHGGLDHAHNWDWVARSLRKDWHILCPDLRGHGDSAWSQDGAYSMPFFVSDLARLIRLLGKGPVTLVGHSLGGAISLRYAGLYPENVRRVVAIEGLGLAPDKARARQAMPVAEHWRDWIEEREALSTRASRRYERIEEAHDRMRQAHGFLSEEQIDHLTRHGARQNADGSWSWKFDNYVRSEPPSGLLDKELHALWHNIDCPVWLVHGADSWASHPGKDGRAAHFRDVRITSYERAGHWVHHERTHDFVTDLEAFIQVTGH